MTVTTQSFFQARLASTIKIYDPPGQNNKKTALSLRKKKKKERKKYERRVEPRGGFLKTHKNCQTANFFFFFPSTSTEPKVLTSSP